MGRRRRTSTPLAHGARAVLALVFLLPAQSAAQPCAALPSLSAFDEASLMAAIFCAYDPSKKGTLLPAEFTSPWAPDKAETLATPMLAETYRENGVEKGVLVVQRQTMYEGEPVTSHAQMATVSVYVFARRGDRWTLAARNAEVLEAGAYGVAPSPELIRIAPDRYGLWLTGGNMGQGYTSAYAHIVTISGPEIAAAGQFAMGEGNPGTCSDDPRQRSGSIHPCWGWETTLEFVRVAGRDDYVLRLTSVGTHAPDINDPDRIAPKRTVECYANDNGTYTRRDDPRCATHPIVDKRTIP